MGKKRILVELAGVVERGSIIAMQIVGSAVRILLER